MRGTLYTRQDLCNAVYNAVASSEVALTRLEICERIGRKKSPHVMAMIEHLHNTGWFDREDHTNARKNREYRYSIRNPERRPNCEISDELYHVAREGD